MERRTEIDLAMIRNNVINKELANAVGVSEQYMSNIRMGRQKTAPAELQQKIATHLNSTVEDLFPKG